MKNLFLLFAGLIAFTFKVSAQDIGRPQTTAPVAYDAVQKGNWLVGAGIGSIGQNFKSKTFNLDVQPRAGYFISDNAALGLQAELGLSIYNGGETFSYGAYPFIRYYFPEGAAPTHRWFGEGVVGFGGSSLKDNDGDSFLSSVYGVRAGYAHFVASNVALEGNLSLIRSHANINVGENQGTGLSLGLALQIYLPGRGNR